MADLNLKCKAVYCAAHKPLIFPALNLHFEKKRLVPLQYPVQPSSGSLVVGPDADKAE